MCGKLLAVIFVLIALAVAILGIVLPPEHIDYVIMTSKFFDIMLPILAVGALLKYLCKSYSCCCGSAYYKGTCTTTPGPDLNQPYTNRPDLNQPYTNRPDLNQP